MADKASKATVALRAAFHKLGQTRGGKELRAKGRENQDDEHPFWQQHWELVGNRQTCRRFNQLAKRAWAVVCRLRGFTPPPTNPVDTWLSYAGCGWNRCKCRFGRIFDAEKESSVYALIWEFAEVAEASELAMRKLKGTPEPIAGSVGTTKPGLLKTERALRALVDDVGLWTAGIANDPELSTEQKMMAIVGHDARFDGCDSKRWAELLGVPSAAVRRTNFWTELQKRKNPEPAAVAESKGVALRDRWFLSQYEAHETDTYRRPAAIHKLWNGMTKEQQATICPTAQRKVAYATVVMAIKRARIQRDGKPSKRKWTAKKRGG